MNCQAHDVVAAEVYGEDAVRVTPPPALATNLASTGDEVEGPNGECPPVSPHQHNCPTSLKHYPLATGLRCCWNGIYSDFEQKKNTICPILFGANCIFSIRNI